MKLRLQPVFTFERIKLEPARSHLEHLLQSFKMVIYFATFFSLLVSCMSNADNPVQNDKFHEKTMNTFLQFIALEKFPSTKHQKRGLCKYLMIDVEQNTHTKKKGK